MNADGVSKTKKPDGQRPPGEFRSLGKTRIVLVAGITGHSSESSHSHLMDFRQ
jgi:hypothetical protein